MRYILFIGIGLAIWGLVTLDWFQLGIGALLFLGSCAWELHKKRAVIQSGKLFSVYEPLHQLLLLTKKAIEARNLQPAQPKTRLASALFFIGMIDAASQSAGLDEKEFLNLLSTIFQDLDYTEPLISSVLTFYQSAPLEHRGYAAITEGGEVYTKFYNGNRTIVLAAGTLIEKFVNDPNFPATETALLYR